MTEPSPTVPSQLVRAVEVPGDINVEDLESLVSALTINDSEVADLCDSFTELCVDLLRKGVGRANAQHYDSLELFA